MAVDSVPRTALTSGRVSTWAPAMSGNPTLPKDMRDVRFDDNLTASQVRVRWSGTRKVLLKVCPER